MERSARRCSKSLQKKQKACVEKRKDFSPSQDFVRTIDIVTDQDNLGLLTVTDPNFFFCAIVNLRYSLLSLKDPTQECKETLMRWEEC
ncbi:hypothetical protein NPIL_325001 [Nephila pilipes]|uniref:Uncharacterized protein n=1 Tax=Nephila pilipes TaxID=299642 RepID=A0A8X6MUH2_NEPPI|nr:hypothetical protein NPIL_325001 [Nephila pilipes]